MTTNQVSTPGFDHHPDHDHYTLLFDSREEQFSSVAPFVREGIGAGERCMYLVHDNSEQEVVSGLREYGIDVDAALESGQFTIHEAGELYLPDDGGDPAEVVDRLREMTSEAVEAGYERLRITGEMTWAADVETEWIETYERKIESFLQSNPVIGLCQYRRSRFPPEFLDSILKVHPWVVRDAESCLNCYYESPEERSGDGHSSAAIDRKLETISGQNHLSDSLQEREECLSLLGQATDQLREVDPGRIERVACNLVMEVLDSAVVSFAGYDETAGELRTRVVRDTTGELDNSVGEAVEDPAWEAFVENEPREFAVDRETRITGEVLPVGEHGVLLVGTPEAVEVTETDLDFVTAVVGHTEATLDRASYECRLEKRNEELSEKNDHLERAERINTVIREVNHSLVDATTTEEVVEQACDLIVREMPVEFAWYGSYESATESLDPVEKAGSHRDYLDALALEDDWTSREPSGRAVRTREIVEVDHVYDGPPLDHWQKQALDRGFQTAVSIPVCFNGAVYGVLSLYSDAPNAFGDGITDILGELGDCVAHAINSIKRKRALVTEEVCELELQVTERELPAVNFVDENEYRVDVNEVVSTDDGTFHAIVTFHGATLDEIDAFTTASPMIDSIELLSGEENAHTCKCTITDQCFVAELLNHNVVPQSVRVEKGKAHLVVQLPRDESVRNFVEMFTRKYPSAEVVARRDREESLRRIGDVESRLSDELTDRQLEIVQLAYHSGYFERPREQTAEDIADTIGVSHPTVSRHLREAERRLFEILFGEE